MSEPLPTVNDWIGKAGRPWEGVRMDCGEPGLATGILNAVLFSDVLTVTGSVTSIIGIFGTAITRTIGMVGGLKSGFETRKVYGMYAADGIKAMGPACSLVGRGLLRHGPSA